MNVNVPNLIKATVPDAEGRNVQITSQNGPNYRDSHFLSDKFPRSPPKLYIIAEADDFDPLTVADWRDEGFNVQYISMESCKEPLTTKLRRLSKDEDLGPCQTFGIVAFGDAAAQCLEHYHVMNNNPDGKLGLLIAYYPTAIPNPHGCFPSSIRALVHLCAGEEIGVTVQTQIVGIQGKRRTTRQRVDRGLGTGGTLRLAYPTYAYNAEPGFAEHDMEEYDRVSADLAWSRSLTVARRAFGSEPDWEDVLDANMHSKFFTKSPENALATYTTHKSPHVTNIPTLTGAIGTNELKRFYSNYFSNPPSMKLTLLSRTIGIDRVVDEMHVQFKHTQEVPWLLPGVPATDKKVEILLVSIVVLRGGKLFHEHVYWDQASVLVQIGLLDPKLVPEAGKKLGVKRLPIVGRKAARRVLKGRGEDEEGEADNELILGKKGENGKENGKENGVSKKATVENDETDA
ncbi:hypothetical protein S40285_04759 [Stachybotrys chlorohalonatus IBT 40285]|uniref:SnoaL-like domain-containing protein n=1 Tax=Stachybotrys chlorohalonatus (strain IBT 40285) TaxID=1283841 RepID=A0A084QGQ5_STAC4|nr:hypothetical protein S40285_04759 [Stachybotrys chlorohalonata IBT 40285]